MIDLKEICEAIEDTDPVFRRSDKARRVQYSIGRPADVVDILGKPVDMTHHLKLVRMNDFNPAKFTPRWRLKLMPGVCTANLGKDMTYGVRSERIEFYENGMARAELAIDEKFIDNMIAFADVRGSLDGNYDADLKSAKAAASEKYKKEHPFDPDAVYKIKYPSKHALHMQQQAIAKKRSNWQKNHDTAVDAAVDAFNSARNEKIVADGGFSEYIVRIICNGSLTDDGVLYWYPTILDLCRMFKHIVVLPTKLVVAVNDNDQNDPFDDSKFVKDILFESWKEVCDGKTAFDDIRDSSHRNEIGVQVPFPVAKNKRWDEFRAAAHAKDIPLKDYKGIQHLHTGGGAYSFDSPNGKMTTIGDLGKIFCTIDKMSGPYESCKCIILQNGIAMLYTDDGKRMLTAMITPPETLIKIIKYAVSFDKKPQKFGIPVWLMRKCFSKVPSLPASGDMYTFISVPGTRRYIA